ncbi:MAG: hypothetical protein SGJ19_02710 [Planctomycetia bacterium]|nr:hypothetical protein [Planctomycetia bacterium]
MSSAKKLSDLRKAAILIPNICFAAIRRIRTANNNPTVAGNVKCLTVGLIRENGIENSRTFGLAPTKRLRIDLANDGAPVT